MNDPWSSGESRLSSDGLEPILEDSPAQATLAGAGPIDELAGRRSLFRPAMVGAIATLGLAVGISVAAAQTGGGSSTTPSTAAPSTGPGQSAPPGPGGPHGRHGGMGFGGMGFGGKGGVIRGEFVRPDGSGGFQTVDIQTGEVMAVSPSAITIKSADGVSKTYVVDTSTLVDAGRDGIADVKTGDTAGVEAVVNGGSAKARRVMDRTRLEALRQQSGGAGGGSSTTPTTKA